jgi:hypothetical protein
MVWENITMERRKFMQCTNLCGVGLLGLGCTAAVQAETGKGAVSKKQKPLVVRPYQLLCTICSMGEEGKEPVPQYEKVKKIRDMMQKNPDGPVTLNCQAGTMFDYQESGKAEDTPESDDFNRLRDLTVLQMLDLEPGATLPARIMFRTVQVGIPSLKDICSYDTVTGEAWKGCPKAASGNYKRGFDKALTAPRAEDEMVLEKKKSIDAINAATVVTVRPHILVCAVCQYGDGARPPFKADNLPELMDIILNKNPDLTIKMAPGADWMICAPCATRSPRLNACMNTGDIVSQQRDLRLLQKLGLTYGSTIKARDLYKLIFERVTTTHGTPDICLKYNAMPSLWCDSCSGSTPIERYEKGKKEMMEKLKLG